MSLMPPQLDDRKFQDIVDEAKKRITYYCQEWTDHNVSDPGVTLIELFAWMVDLLLYRLNQVPKLHYVKFMQMFGITLKNPVPAKTAVTFWLVKPQPSQRLATNPLPSLLIPAGTEVATTQTETEASVIFSTEIEAEVRAPHLSAVVVRVNKNDGKPLSYSNLDMASLVAGREEHLMFTSNEESEPTIGSALYFGFENDLSHHILRLDLTVRRAGGANVVPGKPPYEWYASTGQPQPDHWQLCDVEEDTTLALNEDGYIVIHLPHMGKYPVNNKPLFWVRVQLREIRPEEKKIGIQPYRRSPKLRKLVNEQCLGMAVMTTQARTLHQEYLGRSDGSPGQRFQLQGRPVLDLDVRKGETLFVHEDGKPDQAWQRVGDFADSGMDDRHYVLDYVSGEVRLGPAVRQRDGTMKLYGAIPARNLTLFFGQYRCGGGQRGNILAGQINTLKTSIPFIDKVGNRRPASGGMDEETLDEAMIRASALLRSRERAVTADDFEFIARTVLREKDGQEKIGRVRCIQPREKDAKDVLPNLVYVLVIARVEHPVMRLQLPQLLLSQQDKQALAQQLEERRPLTMRVEVRDPAFYWVALRIRLTAAFDADKKAIETELLTRLYRFINPLVGGEDGKGWPFGREISIFDVYPSLQNIPGVHFIREVHMFEADAEGNPTTKNEKGELAPVDRPIKPLQHGVIASGRHWLEFVDAES